MKNKKELKESKKASSTEIPTRLTPTIGGDLEKAALSGKAIGIFTDAEVDDGRAINLILKSLSHIISTNEIEDDIHVAMVVGDGVPKIRLKLIKTLVDALAKDGLLSKNIKFTYSEGVPAAPTTEGAIKPMAMYDTIIHSHLRESTEVYEESMSMLKFLETYGQKGSLIYALKEPQELIAHVKSNPEIFKNSDLYTYFGGHNYKQTHGPVVKALDSFQSVKAFSNFVALQNKNAENPRDITPDNTPEISKVMSTSTLQSIGVLKLMTLAWNSETIYKMCTKKLTSAIDKIMTKDKGKIEKAEKAEKPAEELSSLKESAAKHIKAAQDLIYKINEIRKSDGSIDIAKINVTFIKSLNSDLQLLPQKFPVNMWTAVTAEPELQSVLADDLPALASFYDSAEYEKGHAAFLGLYLGVDPETEGNLSFAQKILGYSIKNLDQLEAYLLSERFPPKMDAATPSPASITTLSPASITLAEEDAIPSPASITLAGEDTQVYDF